MSMRCEYKSQDITGVMVQCQNRISTYQLAKGNGKCKICERCGKYEMSRIKFVCLSKIGEEISLSSLFKEKNRI